MERSEFETWLCHRVVFLGETLDSHSAPLHPGISMDTREFSGKPDVILGGNLRMNWRPIQGGGVVIFLGTYVMETAISSGWIGHLPPLLNFH